MDAILEKIDTALTTLREKKKDDSDREIYHSLLHLRGTVEASKKRGVELGEDQKLYIISWLVFTNRLLTFF